MALDFVAGCFGGCAGVIVGHPFDTVKVKLQTQDYRNPVYRGTWDCFAKILKTESVRGIYKGVSSPMAGVAVVNAIVFGVYGNVQKMMTDPDSLKSHFMAGALAGLTQSIVASPVELVKTRMQVSAQSQSTVECFKKICVAEGVRGVFRGLGITAVREFLGYGLYFSTYEALTRVQSADRVGTGTMLLAGGISGTVSWVFTYPLDVLKSRFQADTKYCSIMDCLKQSVKEEGLVVLTRGLTPTIIRAFPTNAVTFTVVTWMFRLADIETGSLKDYFNAMFKAISLKNYMKELDYISTTAATNNIEVSWSPKITHARKYFADLQDFWLDDYSEYFPDNEHNATSTPYNVADSGGQATSLPPSLCAADLNVDSFTVMEDIYKPNKAGEPPIK